VPVTPPVPDRTRDAQRSRLAILDAAETLFAQRGYDGASVADIAAAAGLSRGTPNYFFGSKEQLYLDVLDRAFAARQAATAAAFAPVHAWVAGHGGLEDLSAALTRAADDYLHFLAAHPSFVALVMHEELAGGGRMQHRGVSSTAMRDAFQALHRVRRRRGLGSFNVADAVVTFVALTFAPLSYRHTLMRAVDRDLERPTVRRRHVRVAVDQLMHLLVR
jgi:TetR/AcrR family transcriptional regulator